jgi:hypothetical protein
MTIKAGGRVVFCMTNSNSNAYLCEYAECTCHTHLSNSDNSHFIARRGNRVCYLREKCLICGTHFSNLQAEKVKSNYPNK